MMSSAHASINMITAMFLIKMNTRKHLLYGFGLDDISMGYYVRVNNLLLKRLNLSGIGIILLNGRRDMRSLSHSSHGMCIVLFLINMKTINHLQNRFRTKDISMGYYVKCHPFN